MSTTVAIIREIEEKAKAQKKIDIILRDFPLFKAFRQGDVCCLKLPLTIFNGDYLTKIRGNLEPNGKVEIVRNHTFNYGEGTSTDRRMYFGDLIFPDSFRDLDQEIKGIMISRIEKSLFLIQKPASLEHPEHANYIFQPKEREAWIFWQAIDLQTQRAVID